MKSSPGNPEPRPLGEAAACPVVTATPPPPAERKSYRKPELKRLGLLRSVTGSNIVW